MQGFKMGSSVFVVVKIVHWFISSLVILTLAKLQTENFSLVVPTLEKLQTKN